MAEDSIPAGMPTIAHFIESLEKTRALDHRTPLQILRDLNAEVVRVVVPYLNSLERRADLVSQNVSDVANLAIAKDMPRTDSAMEVFARLERNADAISKEIEQIETRRSSLPPDSLEIIDLARALKIRLCARI